jgi:phospholipase C
MEYFAAVTERGATRSRVALAMALLVVAILVGTEVVQGSRPASVESASRTCESPNPEPLPKPARPVSHAGLDKIKHVIFIMQENRSFDEYFGTYPGADGIPMQGGTPTVSVSDPRTDRCVKPYHDPGYIDAGGPHSEAAFRRDLFDGRMSGFIAEATAGRSAACANDPLNPKCRAAGRVDVMGYKTAADIPNYWSYARHYVLADHMFESVDSWSLPAHLSIVSGWSALCPDPTRASTCRSDVARDHAQPVRHGIAFPWTDFTYLLHRAGVSWRYYISHGTEPDCRNAASFCKPVLQGVGTPGIWNPLPWFQTVHEDHQLGNVESVGRFYRTAATGHLSAVSWIAPSGAVSEHAPFSIQVGQAYVTGLIDAVMEGPEWKSTAIFLFWDDWGGFYDHVVPPKVDGIGYGFRVPALLVSPYAKRGFIDHQTLSFDAYLKFVEDVFLRGQRLNPKTDGRPDPRPIVRENVPILGDLAREFDFSQQPRRPVILPPFPG